MEEIWKDIKGYEGRYQVSNLGNVKSLRTNKLLYYSNSDNYYRVSLYKNKRTMFSIHRLVAEAFIPNPNNLPCVNHKDCNTYNNKVDNLNWCTYKQNNEYGNIKLKAKSSSILKIVKSKYKDDKELLDLATKLNEKIKSLKV